MMSTIKAIIGNIECDGYERRLTLDTAIGSLVCSYFQPEEELEPGQHTTHFFVGETLACTLVLRYVMRCVKVEPASEAAIRQERSASPNYSVVGMVSEQLELDTYRLDVGSCTIDVEFEDNVDLAAGDWISVRGELTIALPEE